jgi:phage terminase large subunit-like protein
LRQYTNPGFDVELLPNNNVLFVLPRKGVYEVDHSGKIVWSYLTGKISHDADRLPDGNTIFVFGALDRKEDAQVTEINQRGETVWNWHAGDWFDKTPYRDINNDGWTHTNAVTRLPNGNTLVSLRNFNLVADVDRQGLLVRTIGEGIFQSQHDPQALPNGNILVANQGRPPEGYHRAVEIDPATGLVVWQSPAFDKSALPVRDANRLPNGNTLITGSTTIVEVTPDGEIVWQLTRKDTSFDVSTEQGRKNASGLGFYKADRIGTAR